MMEGAVEQPVGGTTPKKRNWIGTELIGVGDVDV
jgi:hypothetical protein